MSNNIQAVITILNHGGVVIFPTDTVWGIGCRLDNADAIKRVFKIRERPKEKAVLAVVDSIAMAQKYVQPIPADVLALMKKYQSGLTIILSCQTEKVPAIARGNGETLGVRLTNHPLLLEVLKEIQVPLIAPSANFAGEKTPVRLEDVDKKLMKQVDFVLPGESMGKKASTIVDCSVKPWRVVREGGIILPQQSLL